MSKESYMDFTFSSNVCAIGFYDSLSSYLLDFLAETKFLWSSVVVAKRSPELSGVTGATEVLCKKMCS